MYVCIHIYIYIYTQMLRAPCLDTSDATLKIRAHDCVHIHVRVARLMHVDVGHEGALADGILPHRLSRLLFCFPVCRCMHVAPINTAGSKPKTVGSIGAVTLNRTSTNPWVGVHTHQLGAIKAALTVSF